MKLNVSICFINIMLRELKRFNIVNQCSPLSIRTNKSNRVIKRSYTKYLYPYHLQHGHTNNLTIILNVWNHTIYLLIDQHSNVTA